MSPELCQLTSCEGGGDGQPAHHAPQGRATTACVALMVQREHSVKLCTGSRRKERLCCLTARQGGSCVVHGGSSLCAVWQHLTVTLPLSKQRFKVQIVSE